MKKEIKKKMEKVDKTMKEIYVPPELVEKAKKVDLLTYLQNYEPNELIKETQKQYCTRTHDSLKISNRILALGI